MGTQQAKPLIQREDIAYILDNPWAISEKEWGFGDPDMRDSMIAVVLLRLEKTRENGYSRIWKTQEGLPIALLGAYQTGDRRLETFFLASEHMQEHALKISFQMRRILRELEPVYAGYTCGLYSGSEHPNQVNWFRFLGFRYIPEGNRGRERYFEYVSPSPKLF